MASNVEKRGFLREARTLTRDTKGGGEKRNPTPQKPIIPQREFILCNFGELLLGLTDITEKCRLLESSRTVFKFHIGHLKA